MIEVEFRHHSPVENKQETVSEAIFRAFVEVVERDGLTAVRKQFDIPKATAEKWVQKTRDDGSAGLNRPNLDRLCRIPEVKAAAAGALLRRPGGAEGNAWETIAGELSDLMDPATGWELARKLRDMRDLGLLDGGLSAFDGMITALRRSAAEQASAAKQDGKRSSKEK